MRRRRRLSQRRRRRLSQRRRRRLSQRRRRRLNQRRRYGLGLCEELNNDFCDRGGFGGRLNRGLGDRLYEDRDFCRRGGGCGCMGVYDCFEDSGCSGDRNDMNVLDGDW